MTVDDLRWKMPLGELITTDHETDCHCGIPVFKPGATMCKDCDESGCTTFPERVNCIPINEKVVKHAGVGKDSHGRPLMAPSRRTSGKKRGGRND